MFSNRSVYGNLTVLKDNGTLHDPAGGTGDDEALFSLLLAASDWVDGYCGRRFYPYRLAWEIDGVSGRDLPFGADFVAVDSISYRDDGGLLSEIAEDTYFMRPLNAQPETVIGNSWNAATMIDGYWETGDRRYLVHGETGYRLDTRPVGVLAGTLTAAADSVTIQNAELAVGETVRINAESMLVTAVVRNGAATLLRGINGSEQSLHTGGSAVYSLLWPPAVERAALITVARLYTRSPDFEPFYVDTELDTDVRLLLNPYRRVEV